MQAVLYWSLSLSLFVTSAVQELSRSLHAHWLTWPYPQGVSHSFDIINIHFHSLRSYMPSSPHMINPSWLARVIHHSGHANLQPTQSRGFGGFWGNMQLQSKHVQRKLQVWKFACKRSLVAYHAESLDQSSLEHTLEEHRSQAPNIPQPISSSSGACNGERRNRTAKTQRRQTLLRVKE